MHDTGKPSNEPDLKEEVREAAQAGKEEYQTIRDNVEQSAGDAIEGAKQQARESAETQRYQLGEGIQAIANALQASVESLRAQGQDAMADYWHTAASSVEDLAKRVKGKPLEQVWVEAEHTVREQPGLAFGGAVAAGLVLSRFLKSGSPDPEPAARRTSPNRAGAPGAPPPGHSAHEPTYPGPMGV